jgi:hypothetical protein
VQLKLNGEQQADYVIEQVDCCSCCGKAWHEVAMCVWANGEARCDQHHDRNPCAIEACARTTAADGVARRSDQWLCHEHWRRFVPPRMRARRLYHAYFRKAKRYGWTDHLYDRFRRFWDRLIIDVRRRSAEGDLDITAIEKMFGL